MGENVYIRDLIDFDVTMSTSKLQAEVVYTTSLRMVSWEVFCNVRRSVADLLHATPEQIFTKPYDKKQWSLEYAQDRDVGLGGIKTQKIQVGSTSFKTRKYSEAIFSFGSAIGEDFIYVVLYLIGTFEDEVKPIDNEMVNILASKQSGVGYGTKSLQEQYREIYENAKYDYDPYDDDLYEGQKILDHIQSICDNFEALQEIWEQGTAFFPATFVAGEKSLNDKNWSYVAPILVDLLSQRNGNFSLATCRRG
ncbi:hypothetical protein Tco_0570723 [Tanacetum coccineum]